MERGNSFGLKRLKRVLRIFIKSDISFSCHNSSFHFSFLIIAPIGGGLTTIPPTAK